MSDPRPRELVLASAGSGKTFHISSRIIALLAQGIRPSTVLASTFTRKAAGEILARVLGRLARGASTPEEARTLGEHTGFPEADPTFWSGVLAGTMRAVHELDVGTLDAFFSRAVRSFGHELGLPAGWTVADDATAERIRARALEAVLDGGDQGVMVELVRGIRGGDVRRSVHEGLSREVDRILEIHRDLSPEGPGWGALGEVLREKGVEPGEEVEGSPEDGEDEVEELAAELGALPLPTTKAGNPRADWVKAVGKIREALRAGAWEGIFATKLMTGALADVGVQFSGAEIDADFRRVLRRIAGAATRFLLLEYDRRARAMERLGAAYDEALDRTLREGGVLRFEDVTRLLTGDHGLAGRPETGYRLDGGTRHLLLDEFQDTSLMQWKALRPLADALLGDGSPADGSAAVVADPKQSIYGWRGAAPVVVEAVDGRYTLHRRTLDTSWRSSQVVLDAVNQVFGKISAAPAFDSEVVDRATAEEWSTHFRPHTAERDLPGHVTLSTGPEKEGRGSSQPAFMRAVAERVKALNEAAPERSLGVLVRRNEAVARLILELRSRGVKASEEGGTRLVDSPAVVSVLALLRLADHPGNRLARYHVAGTPVGPVLGFDDPGDDAGAAALALDLRRRLVHEGYGPTLARLRDLLTDHCDARDELRLAQLVELGYRQDDRPAPRVDEFVQTVEASRMESPGGNPVRVMTVWGAKGLEFDVVVLPELFLGMVTGGPGGPPLAYRPVPTGGVTHAFPPVKKDIRGLFEPHCPELAGAYAQHRAGMVRDALSGLYVAMTRARYALHLVVPAEPEKPSGGATTARLLRWALDAHPEDPTEPGQLLFEAGSEGWIATAPPPRETGAAGGAAAPAAAPAAIPLKPLGRRTRMLPRRRPSDHTPGYEREPGADAGSPADVQPEPGPPGEIVDLERLLGLEGWDREGVPATVKGSVVHAWMEAVEWLDDGLPDPGERHRLARREAPELAEEALSRLTGETWDWLESRLADPAMRAALTRGEALRRARERHPDAELVVERELPFYRRQGDALVEGIIDRLVLVRAAGTVVAAHVLDYKTDAVRPDDEIRLKERTALYAPQLRAYREAVAEAYRLSPEAVRLTLLFLDAGKAVELP